MEIKSIENICIDIQTPNDRRRRGKRGKKSRTKYKQKHTLSVALLVTTQFHKNKTGKKVYYVCHTHIISYR